LGIWRRRAADFRRLRDAVSFEYTRAYGMFRPRFLEMGRRLVDRGLLEDPEDVWYLEHGELRDLIDGQTGRAEELVARRRSEIEAVRDLVMPDVIFGTEFVPAPAPGDVAEVLRGIPTSRGVYRGPVRVVRGREAFGRVVPGDVLVVPYSDVGWTPLFARAGAVVAESGGILSHSSIVAREYGIPCVVSVSGACRLPDGAEVVVDGFTGAVTVERRD
jgi:pyruvate,water dikinase